MAPGTAHAELTGRLQVRVLPRVATQPSGCCTEAAGLSPFSLVGYHTRRNQSVEHNAYDGQHSIRKGFQEGRLLLRFTFLLLGTGISCRLNRSTPFLRPIPSSNARAISLSRTEARDYTP